jgi:aromatic-L-amino-acid decarboxylase
MLWRTGPAATELEEEALGWLRELMGLPSSFDGVIYDTASISTLHALAAARQQIVPHAGELGLVGRPDLPLATTYCSDEAHSSVDKAAMLLGLGRQSVRRIPTDGELRLNPERLAAAIAEDRTRGHLPLAVVATSYSGRRRSSRLAGCQPAQMAVHASRSQRVVLQEDGRPARRVRGRPGLPSDAKRGRARNLMDTGIQLGRRFRALKLWMILRFFGAAGIRARLAEHMRLARCFAVWVDDDPRFERLMPVTFSVICFRARRRSGSEREIAELNQRLLDAVNATGEVFLSHTVIRDRFALRVAIGNIRTTEKHVRHAWDLLRDHLARLQPQS